VGENVMAVETLSTARTSISPVVIYWWVRMNLQILVCSFPGTAAYINVSG
jgi:hypothetical protein